MSQENQVKNLKYWSNYVDNWCDRKGWNKNLHIGNAICLVHSEVSEAFEELRNNHEINQVYYHTDEYGNQKPGGFPIELADTIIRICHLAGHYGLDLDALIEEKMAYNEKRPYRHGNKAA